MPTQAVTGTAWLTGGGRQKGLRPGPVDSAPEDLRATDGTAGTRTLAPAPTPPQSLTEWGAAVRGHGPQDVTLPRPHTCSPLFLSLSFPPMRPHPTHAQCRLHTLRMLRLLSALLHARRMRPHALTAGNCSLTREPTNPAAALLKAKAEAGRPKLENPRGPGTEEGLRAQEQREL